MNGKKPSPLEQTLSTFFGPELSEWLLVEMEQNRDKSLAANKVRCAAFQDTLLALAICFLTITTTQVVFTLLFWHPEPDITDMQMGAAVRRDGASEQRACLLQVYPYGRALQESSKNTVKGHDLRGTAVLLEQLRQIL